MSHEISNHSVGLAERGPLPEKFDSLNPYYAFTAKGRAVLLAGFFVAAKYAPTSADLEAAKQKRQLQRQVTAQYDRIADTFACTIDPQYIPNYWRNKPMTMQSRGVFMQMILPHSAEALTEATKMILHQERVMRQVEAMQKASSPLENPNVVTTTIFPRTGKYISSGDVIKVK